MRRSKDWETDLTDLGRSFEQLDLAYDLLLPGKTGLLIEFLDSFR